MLADLIARFAGDGFDEGLQVVTFEDRCLTTLLAKQQMLMASGCSNEGLASLRLVDALDEALFFEGFERAINGDQTQGRMCLTCSDMIATITIAVPSIGRLK